MGEAVHKENVYPGEHSPIIDRDIFDAVQATLTAKSVEQHRSRTINNRSILTGLIFDDRGNA